MNMNNVKLIAVILMMACLVFPVIAVENDTAMDNQTVENQTVEQPDQTVELNVTFVPTPVPVQTFTQYVPIPKDPNDGTGTLKIMVLCSHNLISKDMLISRVVGDPLVPSGRISKEQYDGYNKSEPKTISLSADGTFFSRYSSGVYIVKLLDGNGGQPEYAITQIDAGYMSHVTFIGHAVSSPSGKQVCVIEIIEATYGAVGENCYIESVVDVPAHTEYRVGIWIFTQYNGHYSRHGTPGHYYYRYEGHDQGDYDVTFTPVGRNNGDYSQDGSHYDYEGHNQGRYDINSVTFMGHVDGHWMWGAWSDQRPPLWDWIPEIAKQIRIVPATYKEERHCDPVGEIIDVTQNVTDVVASGHTSFKFMNGPNPGGIFDATGEELLNIIEDPAYGFVKLVKIIYNMGCGTEDKTIELNENEVIDLLVTPS